MATMTEARRTGEFILSEANGTRSREVVTIAAAAGAMAAGTLLGVITETGKYVAYDGDATDGSEVAAAILYEAIADSTADQAAVAVVRDAEVAEVHLTGYVAAAKGDLADAGIIVR